MFCNFNKTPWNIVLPQNKNCLWPIGWLSKNEHSEWTGLISAIQFSVNASLVKMGNFSLKDKRLIAAAQQICIICVPECQPYVNCTGGEFVYIQMVKRSEHNVKFRGVDCFVQKINNLCGYLVTSLTIKYNNLLLHVLVFEYEAQL